MPISSARVLGLDRFPPAHDRGSSHGQTRIIRLAYHEHPDYVPLLKRAYELWKELEQQAQQKLYYEVGLLFAGPPQGDVLSGILRSAAEHDLAVEQLTATEAMARWPGYRVPESFAAIFEKQAGYLLVENCVQAHIDAAVRAGAELRCGVAVRQWKADGPAIRVETDQGDFSADRLVITAGAWASDLLNSLGVPFRVLRKPLFWYQTDDPAYRVDSGCPCFFFETLGGYFYGFPQSGNLGVKIAEHSQETVVEDPLHVDRTLHVDDQRRIEACLSQHLPGVTKTCVNHAVCMYTMTPDEHFLVGSHPDHPQVVFTAGLSGHGFKFTSVLGEIMSQLTLDGQTPHDIEFLSPQRLATKSF